MLTTAEHGSIWLASSQPQRYSPLSEEISCDAAVVGAGITGLTTALLLAQEGKDVVLLERDHIASGSTGNTSAHLTSMTDLSYSKIIQKSNHKSASMVSESMLLAIDFIEETMKKYDFYCGFSRLPGYYIAEEKDGVEILEKEFEAALKAGQPVTRVESIPIPLSVSAAFRIDRQAQFQPVKYCIGLARALLSAGGKIFTGTSVVGMDESERCILHTDRNVSVKAKDVVLATHTPLGINPVQGELSIQRSYALAAELGPGTDINGLYWNTHDPYEYIRFYRTPEGVETVIVGGKDHEVGHGDPHKSVEELVQYTQERFPVKKLLYSWSAQHYDPTDNLPMIGRSPFSSHYHIATGFAGDGLVLGTAAGQVITELIAGRQNRFADLFNPSRFKLSGIKEFAELNIHNAEMLVKDRFQKGKKADQLDPEEASISGGIHPTAAYRDSKNEVHKRSAVCPHLHCIVHHNNEEKSWDCPCHGSRFTPEGNIIEGPALKGLGPEEN